MIVKSYECREDLKLYTVDDLRAAAKHKRCVVVLGGDMVVLPARYVLNMSFDRVSTMLHYGHLYLYFPKSLRKHEPPF